MTGIKSYQKMAIAKIAKEGIDEVTNGEIHAKESDVQNEILNRPGLFKDRIKKLYLELIYDMAKQKEEKGPQETHYGNSFIP